jgi:hypothetical protein
LQRSTLASRDSFDIGFSAELRIDSLRLRFLVHDPMLRQEKPQKTEQTRRN